MLGFAYGLIVWVGGWWVSLFSGGWVGRFGFGFISVVALCILGLVVAVVL